MATDKTKKTIATAAAGAAGAATGSGATIGISQVANASDIKAEATDIKPNEGESIFAQAGQQAGQTASGSNAQGIHSPDPRPVPDPGYPNPEPEPDLPDGVEVLGYETVQGENGTLSDVAVLDVNGEMAMVIDVDRDGEADAIISDLNHDGEYQENEVVDISGQGLQMAPFEQAASEPLPGLTPGGEIADNGPDYTNDANIDDFNMA